MQLVKLNLSWTDRRIPAGTRTVPVSLIWRKSLASLARGREAYDEFLN